jgi:hypothetical protein
MCQQRRRAAEASKVSIGAAAPQERADAPKPAAPLDTTVRSVNAERLRAMHPEIDNATVAEGYASARGRPATRAVLESLSA